MNLLHPKALRVSNLMEGFLEEMRERNLRNVMEFHKQSQQSMHNRKVVNHVAGDRNLVLMRPVKTESFERNTLQEGGGGQSRSPFETIRPGARNCHRDYFRRHILGRLVPGALVYSTVFLDRVAIWFGCKHKELSFPQTVRKRTYVCCLRCGQEFGYDWQRMEISQW